MNRTLALNLALLAAQAYFGRRASRTLANLSLLGAPMRARPAVSVIIPARNEAERLPVLLVSLSDSLGPGDELLVVDDDSSDRTAEIAREAGANVLAAGPLAPAWRGKPNACAVGAAAARHEWLLFLDADTRDLDPAIIDRLVGTAEASCLAAVSLFARQDLESAAEALVVPFAYRHFLAGRSRLHTLNGQCILFRRSAYEAIGGHGSVRNDVAEDTALARVLDDAGLPYMLADGRGVLAVRMYDSLGAALRGFGKNSASFLEDHPVAGAATVLSTTLAGLPFLTAVKAYRARDPLTFALGAAAAILDARLSRRFIRDLSGSTRWPAVGAMQPLAQLLFLAGAMTGMLGPFAGISRQWKGRALDGESSASRPSAATTE